MTSETRMPSSGSVEEFWAAADKLQADTLDHARLLFKAAETASAPALRFLLTQYRYFTIYYIPDLALLIARLEDGRLRSFLSDVLCDELGRGDPSLAHPQLYDAFLCSLGVRESELDSQALDSNVRVLDKCRKNLIAPHNSAAYGVGLRGMGGECVCQVYIAQLYKHIRRNPLIQELDHKLDWRFWDLHVGEHDIQHRLLTREIINEQLTATKSGDRARDIGRGFAESMSAWKSFWENIFHASSGNATRRVISRALQLESAQ